MERDATTRLDGWLTGPERKPLILRGARQVGKTWSVRDLAARHGLTLIELNLERDPDVARAFASNDPRAILADLSLLRTVPIDIDTSLLFIDEIQERGELIAKLRWFYEELPELPVIAAGSLLEFALTDHSFSMPVGRVSFMHLEPMGLGEYLTAYNQTALLTTIEAWRPTGPALSAIAHDQAMAWFDRYQMVGGMPEVVDADIAGASPREIRRLQKDLLATYRADFPKYSGRRDGTLLDGVLVAAARSIGQKFVYSRVGEGVKHHSVKAAIELLEQARVCTLVRHTSANGLPLAAEVNERYRKPLMLDISLLHALLSTPAGDRFPTPGTLTPTLRGALMEQSVGQLLRLNQSVDGLPGLHYWQRGGGRPGEIDYVTQLGTAIIPIEVKAGASGAMKSLHQFMHDKQLNTAVRVDRNPPSVTQLDLATTKGQPVSYRLLSVPPYLVGRLPELV